MQGRRAMTSNIVVTGRRRRIWRLIVTNPTIEPEDRYCAHNYYPLPVVLVRGGGPYVRDDEGRR